MSDHAMSSVKKESSSRTVEKCLSIVKDYRREKVLKSGTIYAIIGAINEVSEFVEQDQRISAAGSYIARLNQFDAYRTLAAQRGSGRSGSHSRTFDEAEDVPEEDPGGEVGSKRPLDTPEESASSKKHVVDEAL